MHTEIPLPPLSLPKSTQRRQRLSTTSIPLQTIPIDRGHDAPPTPLPHVKFHVSYTNSLPCIFLPRTELPSGNDDVGSKTTHLHGGFSAEEETSVEIFEGGLRG
mmetsp:Transcript_15313/g.31187  ORF Transcript_15313/g.31187 Transcript_15313/m.31187 type:complete len:104 (+) Transcript_15313:158-469(+)